MFRVDSVIKRKSYELYVKWKGYNSFSLAGLLKRT